MPTANDGSTFGQPAQSISDPSAKLSAAALAAKVAKQSLCQIGGDGIGDHPLDGVSKSLDHAIHTFGEWIEEKSARAVWMFCAADLANSFKRSLVSSVLASSRCISSPALLAAARPNVSRLIAPASINSGVVATTQLRALRPACERLEDARAFSEHVEALFATSASSSSAALLALIASSVSA